MSREQRLLSHHASSSPHWKLHQLQVRIVQFNTSAARLAAPTFNQVRYAIGSALSIVFNWSKILNILGEACYSLPRPQVAIKTSAHLELITRIPHARLKMLSHNYRLESPD
jgi:hypothetical protein